MRCIPGRQLASGLNNCGVTATRLLSPSDLERASRIGLGTDSILAAVTLPTPPAAAELDGVSRAFKGSVALDGLSISVPVGAVTVLLGPNGAGKTTALRMLTGALAPDSGEVRVHGFDPRSPEGAGVRSRCGVVAAKPALYDRLDGWDNLRYAAELFELGGDAPLEEAAARFGILDALGKKVGGYSTGMKTRLALARAILHDPDLLLLDEPTSGLDPESSHAVLKLIDGMAADGKTVVMSTHLLSEAEGMSDHVVLMDAGRSVVSGSPDELVRQVWPFPDVVFDSTDKPSLDIVARQPGVMSTERLADGSIRATVESLDAVPAVAAALAAAGIPITRVNPHAPTLEELYLTIRGRSAAGVSEENVT